MHTRRHLTAAAQRAPASFPRRAALSPLALAVMCALAGSAHAEALKGADGYYKPDEYPGYSWGGYGNGGGGAGNTPSYQTPQLPEDGRGAKGEDGKFSSGGAGGSVGALNLINNDDITGGGGGNGTKDPGTYNSRGAGGGGGGAGLVLTDKSPDFRTQPGQKITGGAGGNAGERIINNDPNRPTYGGGGGGGGAGVLINDATLTNASGGSITGGKGGRYYTNGGGNGGFAGAGGDGVVVLHGVFANFGTVSGGEAGGSYGVSNPVATDTSTPKSAGIRMGDNATVINGGTVSGGIVVTGNNNTLELRAGSDIQVGDDKNAPAAVAVQDGMTGNTLVLGGDADGTWAADNTDPNPDTGAGKYGVFNAYKKTGGATWTLTGSTAALTPWTLEAGTLAVAADGALGNESGTLTLDGGALALNGSVTSARSVVLNKDGTVTAAAGSSTFGGAVSGAGGLTKDGAGTLALTGANTYAGKTTVSAGTLSIDGGGTLPGDADITDGATLAFTPSAERTYAGSISGGGSLSVSKKGDAGRLTLTGDSGGFAGRTGVDGDLVVAQGAALGGSLSVNAGGRLAGAGKAGNAVVNSGGTLAGGESGGALALDSLTLNAGSALDLTLGRADPGAGALFDVAGDLTFAGQTTVSVADAGGFGEGLYRIFTYGDALSGQNNLQFGTLPQGVAGDRLRWSAGDHRLDLLNLNPGVTAGVWNGDGNGGGSGVWNTTTGNWLNTQVEPPVPMAFKDGDFAVFAGHGGDVTIDRSVTADGLQLAADGYLIKDGTLTLASAGTDAPVVRVGDGTAAGAGMTGEIASVIAGTQGLRKTDLGTLILSGESTYTGGTTIEGGTLQLGDGAATGSVTGDIVADAGAALAVDNPGTWTLGNAVSGEGGLIKRGPGTTVVTADNTYTGGTLIEDGTLQLGDGGTAGGLTGDVSLGSSTATLAVNRQNDVTLGGRIDGAGSLLQQGSGTTTLTNENSYTGNTTVTDGKLILSGQGSIADSARVSLEGGGKRTVLDVSAADGRNADLRRLTGDDLSEVILGDRRLVLTEGGSGDGDTFAGVISGDGKDGGSLELGGGTQRLTGENTYAGGSQVDPGATLIIGDGGRKGSVKGDVAVLEGGTLVYDRADRYDVNPLTGDGRVDFSGGGTGVIRTPQAFEGELVIDAGNGLALEDAGDVSAARGVTADGTFDPSGAAGGDVRIGHLRGGDDGRVTPGDKNLVITDGDGSEFGGVINGTGGLTVERGRQVLSGQNTYTGDTVIAEGAELQLGNALRGGDTDSSARVSGTLSGDGSVRDLTNRGVVSPGTDDRFGTLRVRGDYAGEGGSLVLHEALGGDDSPGDRLTVAGSTSGTTGVTVINRGGEGGQTLEGIPVITVGGRSGGEFRQDNRIVAGAYDYFLRRGSAAGADPGSWYLTSVYTPSLDARAVRPEAGSYAGNLQAASTMFNLSLDGLSGQKAYTDAVTGERKETSLWMRSEGGHQRFSTGDGQNKTQANRFVQQLGGELVQLTTDGRDRLGLGVMGGYASQHSSTHNALTGIGSKGSVDGYSAGVYGTWRQDASSLSGPYANGWLQYSWFDNSVTGDERPTETFGSRGLSASAEAGWDLLAARWRSAEGTDGALYLRPHGSVTWSGVKADAFTESAGSTVKGSGDNNVQLKAGVRAWLNGRSALDKDTGRTFRPYVEANWLYNTKEYGATMGDTTVSVRGARGAGELKAGVEGHLSRSLDAWAGVGQQIGGAGYSDTQGSVGLRWRF